MEILLGCFLIVLIIVLRVALNTSASKVTGNAISGALLVSALIAFGRSCTRHENTPSLPTTIQNSESVPENKHEEESSVPDIPVSKDEDLNLNTANDPNNEVVPSEVSANSVSIDYAEPNKIDFHLASDATSISATGRSEVDRGSVKITLYTWKNWDNVERVELLADGTRICSISVAPFICDWDTSKEKSGQHKITLNLYYKIPPLPLLMSSKKGLTFSTIVSLK